MPEILPCVKMEVEDLRKLLAKASIDTTVIQNPRRTEVLLELPNNTIVHFACHGYSADNPSQSFLLLKEPLTVSDLTSLNIEFAKFSYLSTCHASAMRNLDLLDESISLSSVTQLSLVTHPLWVVFGKL